MGQTCQLNSQIIDSRFDHANGTKPEAGFDLEPNATYQANSGLKIWNSEFDHNVARGILIPYNGIPATDFQINAYSHDNGGAGFYAVAARSVKGLTVSGRYINNALSSDDQNMIINGGFTDVTVNVESIGGKRALYIGNKNTNVLISGVYGGSAYDVDVSPASVNARFLNMSLINGTRHGIVPVLTTGEHTRLPATAQVPSTTEPHTCAAGADVGRIWVDSSTNETTLKVCMNVSGTVQWVTK
jgi:hypothetical protein